MRRLLAVVTLALAIACGGSDGPTAVASGSVKFTRDANTCNGSPLAFTFFADGNAIGTATLASGASQSFPILAGYHAFSVAVTNTTLKFANLSGTVPSGGTFSYLMTCS